MDILTCLTLATINFSTWYLAIRVNIWCCTLFSHRHLTCYTWHAIYDTGTRYVILDTWSTTRDIWHRHLICCTWYLIHDTWYLTPVLDMSYLTPDLDTQYMSHASTHLACFHMVQVHWPDIVTPDRILLPLILVLYGIFMTITFMGTWHDYYIVTRYLVLLNSCAPELLYTWTPEIGRLLTLLLILYSSWPP